MMRTTTPFSAPLSRSRISESSPSVSIRIPNQGRTILCPAISSAPSSLAILIGAHDYLLKLPAIPQFHVDFVRVVDHVHVREDVAVRSNNEAGAFALDRPQHARVPPRVVFVRLTLEEQIVEWRTLASVVFL